MGIADFKGDGKKEIVVAVKDGSKKETRITMFDSDLKLLHEYAISDSRAKIEAINDFNGDGKNEVIICPTAVNKLIILSNDLAEIWSYTLGNPGNAIVSDLIPGGTNEIIVSADKLYVFSGIEGNVPGDVTGDGKVDYKDLVGVIEYWEAIDTKYDVDRSGTVGYSDIAFILDHWTASKHYGSAATTVKGPVTVPLGSCFKVQITTDGTVEAAHISVTFPSELNIESINADPYGNFDFATYQNGTDWIDVMVAEAPELPSGYPEAPLLAEIGFTATEEGSYTIYLSSVLNGEANDVEALTVGVVKTGGGADVISPEIARVVVNAPESVREGESFTATIDVDSVTYFNSGQFDLSFDSNVLKVTDVVDGRIAGETIPAYRWVFIDKNTIRVLVAMPGIKGVTGSGYLAKIIFEAVGKGGEKSVLDISNGMLVNTEAEEIPAVWIDDEVRIGISGSGYKGKRYTGGEDLTTKQSYKLHGNLIYSVGDSYFQPVHPDWTEYTVNWIAGDLSIPDGTKIEKAEVEVYYCWDKTPGGNIGDYLKLKFNGKSKTTEAQYKDSKGSGIYNYPSGMIEYDVTADFNTGGNTAVLKNAYPGGGKVSIDGMLLTVVYQDASELMRHIWVNKEYDIIYAKEDYGVSSEEATAYAPFHDADLNNMVAAKLITVAPEGNKGDDKNRLYFNNHVWKGIWDGFTGGQLSIRETDVKDYLLAGDNIAKFQSHIPDGETKGDFMAASKAILVVEYEGEG